MVNQTSSPYAYHSTLQPRLSCSRARRHMLRWLATNRGNELCSLGLGLSSPTQTPALNLPSFEHNQVNQVKQPNLKTGIVNISNCDIRRVHGEYQSPEMSSKKLVIPAPGP